MDKLQAALAKRRDEKDDSDLSNLAEALLAIEQDRLRLDDLEARIKACASKPLREVGEVRKLYDEAKRGSRL